MQIGAILTSHSETTDSSESGPRRSGMRLGLLTDVPENKLQVVGNNLLDLATARLREIGIDSPILVTSEAAESELSHQVTGRTPSWERAITDSLAQQKDILFLIGSGEYTDLDYRELLQFHLDRGSSFTQVYDDAGPLEIAILNANALRNHKGTYQNIINRMAPQQERFHYEGYVNHLLEASDFMQLVEDALHRRCNLRPVGTEVAAGIWFGAGAEVDDSSVISGPAFIGAGTRIGAGCTIGSGSAIERACKIDTGTTIENSWILQNTYIGVGLSARRTIVSNRKIFHLDRKTEVAINDRRLIRTIRQLSLANSVAKFSGRFQLNRSAD